MKNTPPFLLGLLIALSAITNAHAQAASDNFLAVSWQNGIALEWGQRPAPMSESIFGLSFIVSYQRTQSILAVRDMDSTSFIGNHPSSSFNNNGYIYVSNGNGYVNSNSLQQSLNYFGLHFALSWHFGNYTGLDYLDPFISLQAGPEAGFVGSQLDAGLLYASAGVGVTYKPTDNLGVTLAYYYAGRYTIGHGNTYYEGRDVSDSERVTNNLPPANSGLQVLAITHFPTTYNSFDNGFVTNPFLSLGVSLIY